MTQAQLDELPVIDERVDVNGTSWLICAARADAPRPFVVISVKHGRRAFARWASSQHAAREIVKDVMLTSEAIQRAGRRYATVPRR